MKKLIALAFLLALFLFLPAPAEEDTLVEWIPFNEEGTLFLRYDTYRDYYVLTDESGQRVERDSFYAMEDWWFHENILIVVQDGRYGYFDKENGWIIQPQFDFAESFQNNGMACVKKDGLWGVIDLEGNMIFEPQFDGRYNNDAIYNLTIRFYDHVAAVSKGGLWGYIHDDGTVLLEMQFAQVKPEYSDDGYIPAKKMGLWGYVSAEGEWLIEPQFGDVESFNEYDVAVIKQNNRCGLIDRNGAVLLEPQFDDIYSFNKNGIARVLAFGQYGLIRADGSVIAEPQFEYVYGFNEGVAIVKKDGLYGYIDENGEWLVEPRFLSAWYFHEGLADVKDQSGLWGYIDKQGQYVIEPQYSCTYTFHDGTAVVVIPDADSNYDVYALIDREGKILTDIKYDYIDRMEDGTFEAYDKEGNATHYAFVGGVFQEISVVSNEMYLEDYYPNEGEKVAVLSDKADIVWDESAPLPRLDGAKALLPVYAAFVQATYPEGTRLVALVNDANPLVTYTNTVSAYERLMKSETDLILCAGPSWAEEAEAAALGVEFELSCIGYEAFVFIVNSENPLKSITVDEIRGIYSGEITSWDALGVEGIGDIIAYQRNENSGSQSTLQKLMGDTPLMEAPSMYVSDGMEDILTTIEYRNYPNAISFTFRFFCKDMIASGVKMLAINGIEPTEENIRNGSYPLITPIYAVTRKGETNPNVQIMLSWITDIQGQELVEKSGYVGIGTQGQ